MNTDAALSVIRTSPLTGVFVTLLAYKLAVLFNRRCKGHPLSNPVLIGVLLLLAWLLATGTGYRDYMKGGVMVQMLLGPATVALAVPLYGNLSRLKRAAGPGHHHRVWWAGGIVSAVVGWLLQLPQQVLLSLTTRAVTTPIAMSVAGHRRHSGVVGHVCHPVRHFRCGHRQALFNLLGLRDDMVLGTATGFPRTASARPGCFNCRKRRVPLLASPWG
jgi:putative effector of murein hydrolase